MVQKPTYEELEQKVKILERQSKRPEYLGLDLLALFQGFDDSFPIGITDHKGLVLYVNNAALEIWGYTNSEEMVGRQLTEFWEGPGIYKTMKDLAAKGWAMGDDTGKRADGSLFPVEFKAIMCRNTDGKPLYMLGQFFDIGEQKKTEEALTEREERFRSIIENTEAGYFFIDRNGLIQNVNESWIKMHKYTSKDEIIGQHFTIIQNSGDVEKAREFVAGIMRGDTRYMTGEFSRRCKDDTIGYHTFSARPVSHFGEVAGIEGFIIDSTERKRAEQKILEERDKAQRYLDLAGVIFVALDTEGKVTLINKKGCEVLGYKEEEIINKNWFDNFLPKDLVDEIKPVSKLLLTGEIENGEYFENPVLTKNGDERLVAWHNTILRDEKGDIIGHLSSGEDITEQRISENALKESEEKLARLKKMESLGLLAGGVAHDLNNVLSGIVSYPELILMDLPENSKLRNPIETMQESGQRAAAIVQDLLTVARGVATTKEPLNLNDIINDYLNSPEFKKLEYFHPTVTIKRNLENDLLNMNGSRIHIRKVVMNLVSNASEAIEGSGNVFISTMNRYIDRPLRGYDDVNIGEYVVLSVSDDGSGIMPVDLERIFEPFYTKKVMGRSGTGLGLAVVWNVVQEHKGYIDVISDENGTTFEMYFPITRNEVSHEDFSLPIEDFKGDGETILVVDDVEDQRKISCKMLDTLGYETKAVSSGKEAIEYLKEHSVDLILLDMIMDPGINGRETYEKISKIHPTQKALIVSGFAETDEVKAAHKLGAGRYVKKPFTLEKIGMAIKEELEK